MESSRLDLLNNVAEHRSILKNNQYKHQPRFCLPKTDSPHQGFCFHCDLTVSSFTLNLLAAGKSKSFIGIPRLVSEARKPNRCGSSGSRPILKRQTPRGN